MLKCLLFQNARHTMAKDVFFLLSTEERHTMNAHWMNLGIMQTGWHGVQLKLTANELCTWDIGGNVSQGVLATNHKMAAGKSSDVYGTL